MSSQKSFIYNPAEKPRTQLIEEFTVRQIEFDKVIRLLREADTKTPPQHILIAGQRGMGKTTLLLRLKYAIEDDKKLNQWLLPVRFSEEQYNIGRLERLWEETAAILESKYSEYEGLVMELESRESHEDYERVAFEILSSKLKQEEKRAVLMIDNIGELFDKFSETEAHRLREVLMTSPEIQIIGASSRVLEHTFRYERPFFEFFNEVKLDPLNKEGSIALLKTLGKAYARVEEINDIIESSPERLEVLRRITGGVPRTIVLLFEIFVDHQSGSAFDDLQLLLDHVNSLYKHRMDELKPQQQQIIDALARAWEPISSGEILQSSRLYREDVSSNQISAQLKQLIDNQVVESVEIKGKRKTYRIRERFFNIWYLMRHGRKKNKEEVLWLIKFLESWCSMQDLYKMADMQLRLMQEGMYSERGAYYKAVALSSISGLDNEKKQDLLKQTESYLHERNRTEWADNLKQISNNSNQEFLQIADIAYKNQDYEKAKENYLKAIKARDIEAMYKLAMLYENELANIKLAEKYYKMAANSGDLRAMTNLGVFYIEKMENKELAEEYFMKAAESEHSDALYNLGVMNQQIYNDIDMSEVYYKRAIAKGHSAAMNNLAVLYENVKKDIISAKKYYLQAIEKGNSDAMLNYALLLQNNGGELSAVEKYLLLASENGNIKAMNNLAVMYLNDLNDCEKAERYYLKAIERGSAASMFNMGLMYENEKDDIKIAVKYYTQAADSGHTIAMYNLGCIYSSENEIADLDKAEHYYLMAVANGDRDSMDNLAVLYMEKMNNFSSAEIYLKKAIELGSVKALFNLAFLYDAKMQEYFLAEQYYIESAKNGDVGAMNNLAVLYQTELKDFKKSAEYYELALKKEPDNIKVNVGYINLLIKQKALDKAISWADKFYLSEAFYLHNNLLMDQMMFWLINKQYHFLLKQFQKENSLLIKHAKPIYYVVAYFLKEEMPGEYEKAGIELKETIDEIIATVKAAQQEEVLSKANENVSKTS